MELFSAKTNSRAGGLTPVERTSREDLQSDQCVSQNGDGALPLSAPDDSRSWRLNIDPKSPPQPLPLSCFPFISFLLFPLDHFHSSLALPIPISYLGSPFLLLFFCFSAQIPQTGELDYESSCPLETKKEEKEKEITGGQAERRGE